MDKEQISLPLKCVPPQLNCKVFCLCKQEFVIETSLQGGQQIQNKHTDHKDEQRPGALCTASPDAVLAKIAYNDTNNETNSKFDRHIIAERIQNFKETPWPPKGQCKMDTSYIS